VDCGAPATDVDHLIPVRERPDLALAAHNVAPAAIAITRGAHLASTRETAGDEGGDEWRR